MKISHLVQIAFQTAKEKGFHDNDDKPGQPGYITFGDRIALVHSELSEALEAYRVVGDAGISSNYQHLRDGKKPEGIPAELADVVIRVADMCGTYGIDLETAIAEKLLFNKSRPYRHGKKL